MNAKNIQLLKSSFRKEQLKKNPDLLDCNLFASSLVSSDSAHLLIYSSVFMGHCLSLFGLLITKIP